MFLFILIYERGPDNLPGGVVSRGIGGGGYAMKYSGLFFFLVWKKRLQVVCFSSVRCFLKLALPHGTRRLTHTHVPRDGVCTVSEEEIRNLKGRAATVSRQESKGPR